MNVLIDTNILLRASQPSHAQFAVCVAAIEKLAASGFVGCMVPQVIYEYWVVATRPESANGLGLSTKEASKEIDRLVSILPLLRDERGIYDQWRVLVEQHQVQGKSAHDARLVAAMQRHRVQHLLTLNAGDFQRYPDITIHSPEKITA